MTDKQHVEYIVISELNFARLKQIPKLSMEIKKQVYEDIPGFESLRIIFKISPSALYLWFPQFHQQSFFNIVTHNILNLVDKKTEFTEKQYSQVVLKI